jgi:hypothetical protein
MKRLDLILTWNMGCVPAATDSATIERRLDVLKGLVGDHSPTLIALQEAPPESKLRNTLGARFDLVRTAKGVTNAYESARWSCDKKDTSLGRVAVLGLLATGGGTKLWFVNAHGPALYVDDEEKRIFVRDVLARHLEALRKKDDQRREVVVGDINLPPFDTAIMRKGGLYASRCLPWVRDRSTGMNRALFNPTWSILADHSGPSGTLYRSEVGLDGPWCAIDQVLISAELAGTGINSLLEVVQVAGGRSLRTKGRIGAPDVTSGSDHLPLLATISVA